MVRIASLAAHYVSLELAYENCFSPSLELTVFLLCRQTIVCTHHFVLKSDWYCQIQVPQVDNFPYKCYHTLFPPSFWGERLVMIECYFSIITVKKIEVYSTNMFFIIIIAKKYHVSCSLDSSKSKWWPISCYRCIPRVVKVPAKHELSCKWHSFHNRTFMPKGGATLAIFM